MNKEVFWTRVLSRRDESSDVVSWRLVAENSAIALPRFEAGAHIDVHIGGGLIRKYSLCNDPDEAGIYEIAVKLEAPSRGGSVALHKNLRVGSSVKVSRPINYFPIDTSAEYVVLVAAGIGITPIIAMAHSLQSSGGRFELYYFSRSDDAAFVKRMKSCSFSSRVNFRFGLDNSETLLALQKIFCTMSERTHVYFCGPLPFMSAINTLASHHLSTPNVHCEFFSTVAGKELVGQESFEVVLARSGVTLTVPPHKSITDVLDENAIQTNTSCEAGICGACVVNVLDGVPLHQDEVLTIKEKGLNNKMLPCVSRSCGPRLVLDL